MKYHTARKGMGLIRTFGITQMYYSKQKKPDSKRYLLYDSAHMVFWERQNHKDRKQIVDYQGLVREVSYKEVQGNLFV